MQKLKLFSFSLLLYYLINCKQANPTSIQVVHGNIDFTPISFKSEGPFALDGIWNIYPGQSLETFLTGKQFGSEIQVPGEWSAQGTYPKKGIVLYRLVLNTKEETGIFGLKLYEFPQAYRIYINRELILENGHYSTDLTKIRRSLVRPIALFNLNGPVTEILIEAANLDETNPGPRRSILFGTKEQILNIQDLQHFSDMVSFGILFIMALYHFGLYYQRTKEKGSFIFGIFCSVIAFRIFVTEEHYLIRYFPDFPSSVEWMLDVMSFLVLTPLFILLFFNLFKNEFHKFLIKPALILSGIIVFSYLFTRSEIIFNFALVMSFVSGIYFTYLLIRGILNRRTGAKIFFLGWIVFLATAAFDMLAYNNFIRSIYVSHIGFLFFIFSQAYYLSIRFNRALALSEELTESLESKVSERTLALNESLSIIQSDLSLARRLQEAILNESQTSYPDLTVITHYQPVSEVGGDFFDIRQIAPGKFRFFIADATGHGVQAALVTMIIKSECENILKEPISLSQIFSSLNESYTKKFQNLNLFFSAFLCELDLNQNKLTYVSAGHPPQYVLHQNELLSLKPRGKLMGYASDVTFIEEEVSFLKPDKLFLFSDGIYEDFNAEDAMFGEAQFEALIHSNYHLNIKEMIGEILKAKAHFKGSRTSEDDITLLGIQAF